MKLQKGLGLPQVFAIAAGAMISAGLFILPGILFAKAGPSVILAYIVAGVVVLPALFAKAELGTAMPKAGGSYFFIERSMGSAAGTIGGFASWFSLSLKSAFALVGIGVLASLLKPDITTWQVKFIAVGLCVLFTFFNLVSVKLTGRVQIALVVLLIALLALYVFRGAVSIDGERFTPFLPHGTRAFFATCGMVFISFGGLTKVASVAEEIRDPAKNIPRGMLLALCVVVLIYVLTVFVTVGVLDGHELANSLTPLSAGGQKAFGTFGSAAMAFAGMLAFISTANAGILASSRFPLAMSRDQLLPGFLAQVNRRFRTPHFSIVATALFMIVAIVFLDLENLVKVASTMKIVLFIFVVMAAIIMRESKIANYRPAFLSPLYPWLQIVGILFYGFFLYQMGGAALLATAGFILVSLIWHEAYVRRRVSRKSALLYIIERLTAREMAGNSLRDELREILRERDEIVRDRFDRLIEDCVVLDIEEQPGLDELTRRIADSVAPRVGMDPEKLYRLLLDREQETSTALTPRLAIPHVVIEGDKKFAILIARCREGVFFSDSAPRVKTVFVIVGTRDERNFHLRALAAIAQIAHEAGFEKRWIVARDSKALRDLVLLGRRKRH